MTKEVVLINDIAAVASCTLGVSLPILSLCDTKPYPVPTAVFTSSTRVSGFACTSLSGFLPSYKRHWSTFDLNPAAVMAGCFGDVDGVKAAIELVSYLRRSDMLVVVDPVMGDDGHLFASDQHLAAMKVLVSMANVVCPNFTEFCALLGMDYAANENLPFVDKIEVIKAHAHLLGVDTVIVTGIRYGDTVANYVYQKDAEGVLLRHKFLNRSVCGTGDMFSSILLAGLLYGKDVVKVAQFAGDWIMQLAGQNCDTPERGLYLGGERLLAIRQGLLAL